MEIVRAGAADIAELYELQLLAFESEAAMIGSREVPALLETAAENERDFASWVTLKLIDESGKALGAVRYRQAGEVIEVGRLMIHPEHRGRGLAQSLLLAVEQANPGRTMELYTCTKSWINIRLYEKMGYEPFKQVTEDSGLSFVYMRKG